MFLAAREMKSSCLSVCQSCRFLRLPSWASALLLELHTIKFGKSQAQLRLQQKQSVTPHTMRSWLANERRLHQHDAAKLVSEKLTKPKSLYIQIPIGVRLGHRKQICIHCHGNASARTLRNGTLPPSSHMCIFACTMHIECTRCR